MNLPSRAEPSVPKKPPPLQLLFRFTTCVFKAASSALLDLMLSSWNWSCCLFLFSSNVAICTDKAIVVSRWRFWAARTSLEHASSGHPSPPFAFVEASRPAVFVCWCLHNHCKSSGTSGILFLLSKLHSKKSAPNLGNFLKRLINYHWEIIKFTFYMIKLSFFSNLRQKLCHKSCLRQSFPWASIKIHFENP